MRFVVKIFTVFVAFAALQSCTHNALDVDVSEINLEPLKLQRLEQDLFSMTPKNINENSKNINAKYGTFYKRFLNGILNNGGVRDTSYQSSVLRFINDTVMRQVYEQSQNLFTPNEISFLEEQINLCRKRFKFHFPKRKLPAKLVSYNSGFGYSVVYVDSTIGIGLDMYLGANSKFYTRMLQWPQYKSRTMAKEFIVSDVARGWLITEFDNNEPVNNLLNHMMFYGKIFYACDALLPNGNDSLKIGYTTIQMKYCKEYEKNLWGYFAEKNRLYENDLKTVSEFTTDGPFTGAISKECPPRIAMWMGWQIVRSYMKNNQKITLEDLMNEKDSQKILSKSKYRP